MKTGDYLIDDIELHVDKEIDLVWINNLSDNKRLLNEGEIILEGDHFLSYCTGRIMTVTKETRIGKREGFKATIGLPYDPSYSFPMYREDYEMEFID